MTARLINRPGLDLVKMWEGLFLTAYRDIAGVWTIGYGKTGGVYKGEVITQQQADMSVIDNHAPAIQALMLAVAAANPTLTATQLRAAFAAAWKALPAAQTTNSTV